MAKFSIFAEPPEFKPRARLGVPADLPDEQRQLLDALDVMEQKMDYALNMATRAHNLIVLVILVGLIIEGPAIVRVMQNWAKAGSPVAQVVAKFSDAQNVP